LAFNTVIFLAALWALSTEMVEDSLVDLVYGHLYGWRTLVYSLATLSVILTSISAISVYYALTLLLQYMSLVTRVSGILIGLIGTFWLGTSILGIVRKEQGELEEARRKSRVGESGTRNFLVALQLVSIEELEILLIITPLVVASHAIEASLAAAIGVIASVTTASFLRRSFERLVAGKFRYLKVASGTFLWLRIHPLLANLIHELG
jgi:uncharacterized membrane protein